MTVDLSDYYSGGYFLVKADKPDWEQLHDSLLPNKFVSLSRCMCPHLEVYWGWTPGDQEAALNFGIPQDKLSQFIEWCSTEYKSHMDYTSIFYSVKNAQQFIKRFLLNTEDLYIVGAGLHKELEASRWREPNQEKIEGIDKLIEQHLPLETGGTLLGYDVVSYSYHDLSCSWLCNLNIRTMHEMFDVRPNNYGLFETYEDARKVDQWIFEDDMKGTRAEPEPYDVWMLMSYPLTAEG
jgi:hypothetical protein